MDGTTMPRAALQGLALGVAWGAAARVWMRLISDAPEFSWAGTLFILGLAGLLGTVVGLLAAAKAAGRRRWWALAVVPGLVIFAGQGIPFLPAFAIGGLAFSRRRAVPWRLLGVGAIVAPAVLLWSEFRLDEETMTSPGTAMLVRGLVGFVVLCVAMAAAGSVLWRPWERRAPVPEHEFERSTRARSVA